MIHIFKAFRYSAFTVSEAALFRNLAIFIEYAVMTPLVFSIHANGRRSNQNPPG
jgi:hypothetical protein